MLKMLHTSTI